MARPQSPKNMSKAELKAAVALAKGEIKTQAGAIKTEQRTLKDAVSAHASAVKDAEKALATATKLHEASVKAAVKTLAAAQKLHDGAAAKATAAGVKAEARLAELQAALTPAPEPVAAPAVVTPIKAGRKAKAAESHPLAA